MNGRVYDYNVGRFMSVDPFIQSPGNSQSINPYSYIMNNPMSGTDPSGYESECSLGQAGCTQTASVKVDRPGSRTKGTVKVTATTDKAGNVSVTVSGINNGAVKQVSANLASKGADIKNQAKIARQSQNISTVSSINKQFVNPGGRRAKAEAIVDANIDDETDQNLASSVLGNDGDLFVSNRGGGRRGANGNSFQPLINGQVQRLINQIQAINPSYRYSTIRPVTGRGSRYTRSDIAYLKGVLAQMRRPLPWPSNQGFLGPVSNTTLQPGTRIDRYGSGGGYFVSPAGTPFGQRSLPEFARGTPYTQFEVLRPINVQGGLIAPAFGQSGGGTQYIMPARIGTLIQSGHLRIIN